MGVRDQRHAPAALHPGKRHGTHCIGDWVGPRAGLDGCGKSRPHRHSILTLQVPSQDLTPVKPCQTLYRTKTTYTVSPGIILKFKVCKSVRHHAIQINQPTRCNNFPCLLLDVYVRLNMFRASSRTSSGAQQLQ